MTFWVIDKYRNVFYSSKSYFACFKIITKTGKICHHTHTPFKPIHFKLHLMNTYNLPGANQRGCWLKHQFKIKLIKAPTITNICDNYHYIIIIIKLTKNKPFFKICPKKYLQAQAQPKFRHCCPQKVHRGGLMSINMTHGWRDCQVGRPCLV